MSVRCTAQIGVVFESLEQRMHLSAEKLTVDDVNGLLFRAAEQARGRQAIVVSDREGVILGIFSVGNATTLTIKKAAARARTVAFFQSREDAFTTRTARFIIQDHFPHPVPNTPGGPLYGVQFSSLPGSDVASGSGISGDPGGVPLYKNGEPVGGIGVAGDGNDIAVRSNLRGIPEIDVDNPTNAFFNGVEESDFDEKVALAGAQGFMAPNFLRADRIFLDGLRLPFLKDKPATAKTSPFSTLDELIAAGVGSLKKSVFLNKPGGAVIESPDSQFPTTDMFPIVGQLKNTNPDAPNFGIIGSNDTKNGVLRDGSQRLTAKDVRTIITNSVNRALITRAAIRQPIGVPARVHIAVVDRDGDILGVFRMDDGTNFSFDVAVQKARTAAFFSDNDHAFSARAIGFMSQRFFPAGIDGGFTGPLFTLQDELSKPENFKGPLKNAITIFPGGFPLYKNGLLVGAVGVSGDGVNEDDIITDAGTKGFRPRVAIRCDALRAREIVSFLRGRISVLSREPFSIPPSLIDSINDRLDNGLDRVQLPYVKFPRNPEL